MTAAKRNPTGFFVSSASLAEWSQFIEDPESYVPKVRSEIFESWKRSVEQRVDPNSLGSTVYLDEKALRARLQRCADLIDIAVPILKQLCSLAGPKDFVATLTDGDGILLLVEGSGDIRALAEQNYSIIGASRAESHYGTNSIGVALVEKRPVLVSGPDHFKKSCHRWACSSAPIKTDIGEVVGVITLSSLVDQTNPHTFGMVIGVARAIESQLREKHTLSEILLLNESLHAAVSSASDAIFFANERGVIDQMNGAAKSLLESCDPVAGDVTVEEVFGAGLAARIGDHDFTMVQAFGCSDERVSPKLVTCKRVSHDNGKRRTILIVSNFHAKDSERGRSYFGFNDIVGEAPCWTRQMDFARRAAMSTANVLIVGESGTGKEMVAQAIHGSSNRAAEPFVALNCGAIPHDLFESELFGYADGAFTGARRKGQSGKIEAAHGGTLFLDEINSMPPAAQVKLLRVLEDGKVTRLGSVESNSYDVRIVAAASRSIYQQMEAGEFRSDLYYRLSVIDINLPTLAERAEDIPHIVNALMQRLRERYGRPNLSVTPAAMDLLCRYRWPGNFRELQNCLERIVALFDTDLIEAELLPAKVREPLSSDRGNIVAMRRGREIRESENHHMDDRLLENRDDSTSNRGFSGASPAGTKQDIVHALVRANNNASVAAKMLGVSRMTLYRRMNKYRIDRKRICEKK